MRKVLLVESGYKNKYPPIGLMKLSTYHKMLGDEVRYFKGDFKDFIIGEIMTEIFNLLYAINEDITWINYEKEVVRYITTGRKKVLENIITETTQDVENVLLQYREQYKTGEYIEKNKWDRICITTLFTFYFDKTVETINDFKTICKDINQVFVGGVLATVLPDEIKRSTGIAPHEGLLDEPRTLDNNDIIIDDLLLDYSILDDIDYVYPENSGFYGYMTRGCINKCSFCLVPQIEPNYQNYKTLNSQIEHARSEFGDRRNLLLLDNNVLASNRFDEIIDNIIDLGFEKGSQFIEENEYERYINKIKDNKEERINIKGLFKFLINHADTLKDEAKKSYLDMLSKYDICSLYTFNKTVIFESEDELSAYFIKKYSNKRPKLKTVDFNQGVEAKLLTEEKVKKLAQIPIKPLRIAFDHWQIKDTYEKAIRLAAENDICNMSNYLLYNYNDKPEELYLRLKLNVDLCEELDIGIYSFPMKYHPIVDEEYFKNRNYIGKHWNRKFIRAVQAVLNSTKGKIGRGKSFFEEAFGKDLDEFYKILYMPEAFIIRRNDCRNLGLTDEWYELFISLTDEEKNAILPIIESNDFTNINITDDKMLHLISLYRITRDDIEIKINMQ